MGSIHHKIFALFAILAIIATCTGLIVIDSTKRIARLNQNMTLVSDFQLQIKDLQLLRSRMQRLNEDESDNAQVKNFTESQSLTRAIEDLGTKLGSGQGRLYTMLSNQLESFRQAYFEVIQLQNDVIQSDQAHHALLEIVRQRLAYAADDIKSRVQPWFVSFSILHSRIHHEHNSKYLVPLKALHDKIVALVADPKIIDLMNRLMTEAEYDVKNKTRIETREKVLDQMSDAFTAAAEMATAEISVSIVSTQAQLKTIILALTCVMFVTIVLFFLLTRRYIDNFLHGLHQAMRAIRSGQFDYQTQAVLNDELGAQLLFIKEVSTTLKENLTALTASEQRFRNLVENISDCIWQIDQHGICTYSSPRAKDIIGLEAPAIVGQSLITILGSCGHKLTNPTLEKALATHESFDKLVHELHHGGDGRPVIIETSGRPLTDSTGHYQGFTLICRDITTRQRTEMELVKSSRVNSLQNQILSLSLLNVELTEIMYRFLGLLLDCSWLDVQPRAAFFLIDRSKNSLVMTAQRGLDTQVRTACSVLPLGTCLCGRVAQTGKVIFADSDDDRHELSYQGMAHHGHYCLPVHSVAGEIIGVVVLYLNPGSQWDSQNETALVNAATMIGSIIRRRQAEDRLKDLNQNLERQVESRTVQLTAANQELDAFAYSVSHDLHAPLRAIDGFSLALVEDFGAQLPPEAQSYLDRIRAGCARMVSLINDILRLSRLSRNDLDRQSINLSQIAEETVKEIRAEYPHRVVECRIAPDLMAYADPTMMRVVLDNLLGNAWKYSANTAQAKIEFDMLRHDGSEDIYFVRDNGAGFDMRYADKLFKAFQRLHSTEQFAGNGIGLATVQRILHRHGGKIWAQGQVDMGATFYFTLANTDDSPRLHRTVNDD